MRTCDESLDELSPTQVCIDGSVYRIDNFDHPGGNTVQVFGGNDVTVQYKMIHGMNRNHERNLSQLEKVGRLKQQQHRRTTAEYHFDSDFAQDLKRAVQTLVPNPYATYGFFWRVALYGFVAAVCVYRWTTTPIYTTAACLGVSMASIGLNIQHDANHGSISKHYWQWNHILGYTVEFIGGTRLIWITKHWTHHAFTNHVQKDPDTRAAEPLLIFNNYHPSDGRRKWHHAFQVVLLLPAMALYWLSTTLFNSDILTMQDSTTLLTGMKLQNSLFRNTRKWALLCRLCHLLLIFVPPVYHYGPTLASILQALTVGATGSLVLSFLFMLSHNLGELDRHGESTTDERSTAAASSNPQKSRCWYKSQVEASSTYGGTLAGWLTGGLNFQIEHHLFPRMNSAWYPVIAPVVRDLCLKHNVRYTYYPYVWQNAASLFHYVYRVGNPKRSSSIDNDKSNNGRSTSAILIAIVAAFGVLLYRVTSDPQLSSVLFSLTKSTNYSE